VARSERKRNGGTGKKLGGDRGGALLKGAQRGGSGRGVWAVRAPRGSVSNRGALGAADAWVPAGSERERRGAGRVGRPGRKKSGPSLDEP
jgi:hypothetical protein